jgi:membrane protease YdiL (CAAX protease family)
VVNLDKHLDLPLVVPFLSLAIYPVAIFLGFSFNPVEFRWGARLAERGQPYRPMPETVRDRADRVTRYLNFLVDALTLCSIAVLSRRMSLSPARIGLQLANWQSDLLIGVAAGALLVVVEFLVLRRVPLDPKFDFTRRVRKGSSSLWVVILISSAFSEELWVALCLVSLTGRVRSGVLAVALTAFVFATGHSSYGFWGAVSAGAKGTASALLFVHFGSLVATFPYHFIGNLGSLYWNRYWHR